MFKRYVSISAVLIMLLMLLSGCPRGMDHVIEHEPSFRGTVTRLTEDYVIVAVDSDDAIYSEHQIVYVSRNVEQEDSSRWFQSGDEVVVYYDGVISGSDPARAETVYAIGVTLRAGQKTE